MMSNGNLVAKNVSVKMHLIDGKNVIHLVYTGEDGIYRSTIKNYNHYRFMTDIRTNTISSILCYEDDFYLFWKLPE